MLLAQQKEADWFVSAKKCLETAGARPDGIAAIQLHYKVKANSKNLDITALVELSGLFAETTGQTSMIFGKVNHLHIPISNNYVQGLKKEKIKCKSIHCTRPAVGNNHKIQDEEIKETHLILQMPLYVRQGPRSVPSSAPWSYMPEKKKT